MAVASFKPCLSFVKAAKVALVPVASPRDPNQQAIAFGGWTDWPDLYIFHRGVSFRCSYNKNTTRKKEGQVRTFGEDTS